MLGQAGPVLAQVDPLASPGSDVEHALRERLEKIDAERELSGETFNQDKAACASATLVNRCVVGATQRRKAREAILNDGAISARAQLRSLSITAKNEELAKAQPTLQERQDQEKKRSEAIAARARKEAELSDKRAEHQKKRDQEAENRRVYDAKQARAAERQAEVRAKLESAKIESAKIDGGRSIPAKPQASADSKPITSAN